MGVMPDIEADAKRAVGWVENRLPHRHHTTAAPAAAAVTIEPSTPGGPVSLSADLHAVASRLEALGEDAITHAEAIAANPETAAIAGDLATLAGMRLPAGYIGGVASGLKVLLAAFGGQVAQTDVASFTPAGPTVAGQA